MQALEVQKKFIELLMGVKVDSQSHLTEVIPWQPEPQHFPCVMFMYRGHTQAGGAGGVVNRALGLETGVPEFIYAWVWEYYGGLQAGEGKAQENFMKFDHGLAMALYRNPNLGGSAYGTSLAPRTDPGFQTTGNKRYLYVPMDFTATAEEEE